MEWSNWDCTVYYKIPEKAIGVQNIQWDSDIKLPKENGL